MNTEFQRIARRDKNAFFSDQCKEKEENNRMVKTLPATQEIWMRILGASECRIPKKSEKR